MRASSGRVGGDRVGDAVAFDEPHVAPVGGDDQPVGLDQPRSAADQPSDPSVRGARVTSQRLRSEIVDAPAGRRRACVDRASSRWRARARWTSTSPRSSGGRRSCQLLGASGGRRRSRADGGRATAPARRRPSTMTTTREEQDDDRDRRLEAERRELDRRVEHAAGRGRGRPARPGQAPVALAVVEPPQRRGHRWLLRPGVRSRGAERSGPSAWRPARGPVDAAALAVPPRAGAASGTRVRAGDALGPAAARRPGPAGVALGDAGRLGRGVRGAVAARGAWRGIARAVADGGSRAAGREAPPGPGGGRRGRRVRRAVLAAGCRAPSRRACASSPVVRTAGRAVARWALAVPSWRCRPRAMRAATAPGARALHHPRRRRAPPRARRRVAPASRRCRAGRGVRRTRRRGPPATSPAPAGAGERELGCRRRAGAREPRPVGRAATRRSSAPPARRPCGVVLGATAAAVQHRAGRRAACAAAPPASLATLQADPQAGQAGDGEQQAADERCRSCCCRRSAGRRSPSRR